MRGTEVELGGKSRRFRFDFNAIADVEAKAGLGVAAMFGEDRVGFHPVRMLVWGGLKWQEHGLTIERAGQFVQDYINGGGTLADLMSRIHDALEASGLLVFEGVEEGEEGNVEAETAEK